MKTNQPNKAPGLKSARLMRTFTFMPISSRRNLVLILGVIFLSTGIVAPPLVVSHGELASHSPAKPNLAAPPNSSGKAPLSTAVATPVAKSAAPSLANVPAPAALQAILPSVKSAVVNWREYRPVEYIVKADSHSPEITFRMEQVKDEEAFTTWVGRSALPGESFVAVATTDGLDAILTTYGEQPVEIHVRGPNVTAFRSEAFQGDHCAVVPNQAQG